MLQDHGTYLGDNITKHIDEDIWELRPGHNRVFYFCYNDNQFVILHHFRKKSQKTPLREIKKAKRERDDYKRRGDSRRTAWPQDGISHSQHRCAEHTC